MDGVKELKGINGFRGMKGWFIYFIVIYHTFDGGGVLAQLFEPIKRYGGYFGNYIFFMMSGFLVEYSFSKVKVADRDFLTYIMKKLIRLWPLYAICNLIQLVTNIITEGEKLDVSRCIMVLLMQTGGAVTDEYPYVVPGWFLCTLFVCYVVNYFIHFICKDVSKKYIWCFFVLILWGLILENRNFDFPFCYVHDGEGFLNFFMGCLLFELYHLVRKRKNIIYILFAGLSLIIVTPFYRELLGDVRILFTFIICPAVILLMLEESIINSFFTCKLSVFLGSISMSVYLLHTLTILTYFQEFGSYEVGYLIYLIVLISVATITTWIMNHLKKDKFDYHIAT